MDSLAAEARCAAVPDGNTVLVDSIQEYKPFWWPPLLPPRIMWCAQRPGSLYTPCAATPRVCASGVLCVKPVLWPEWSYLVLIWRSKNQNPSEQHVLF